MVERFLAGTLPAAAWTHRAHLLVCHHLLQSASPTDVLADLRRRIPAHNERVGLPAGRRGYHETITRYFVEAVAAGPGTADELLADPACRRDAPQRHWSPEALATEAARTGWLPPDLEPLPWPAPT